MNKSISLYPAPARPRLHLVNPAASVLPRYISLQKWFSSLTPSQRLDVLFDRMEFLNTMRNQFNAGMSERKPNGNRPRRLRSRRGRAGSA